MLCANAWSPFYVLVTRREVRIDYDLDEAASRFRGGALYETVLDRDSGMPYDRVKLKVEISLTQYNGHVRLLLDRGQGILGFSSSDNDELAVRTLY